MAWRFRKVNENQMSCRLICFSEQASRFGAPIIRQLILIGEADRVTFWKSKFGEQEIKMKIQKWRMFSVLTLFLFGITSVIGCGVEPQQKLGEKAEKTRTGKPVEKSTADDEAKPKPKKVKVVSKLPFQNVDPAEAKIGNEVGQKVMAAKGVDSAGKKFGLDDYKGKVILLDTWASW